MAHVQANAIHDRIEGRTEQEEQTKQYMVVNRCTMESKRNYRLGCNSGFNEGFRTNRWRHCLPEQMKRKQINNRTVRRSWSQKREVKSVEREVKRMLDTKNAQKWPLIADWLKSLTKTENRKNEAIKGHFVFGCIHYSHNNAPPADSADGLFL